MIAFLEQIQVYVLLCCGLISLFFAFFSMLIHFRSIRKKKALIKIQLGICALLVAEALAYMFEGDTSSVGYWMIRLSNLVVFGFTQVNIYFLLEYVTALFMDSGKFKKLPKRLLTGFIISTLGLVLVIISQFTGLYYYFDEQNQYHRGPLFMLGYLIPFVMIWLLLSFVWQYRSIIHNRLLKAIIIFATWPFIAGVAQFFFYGLSLIDFAIWQAAVTLFWFVLIDQNEELKNAANTEVGTGLPNTNGFLYEVDRVIHFQNITDYNAFYFDIVRMSHFNNKYDKKTGDDIIYQYAWTIRKWMDKDEILGRLGGNFFVALVKKSNTREFLDLLSDVAVEFEYKGKKECVHVAAVAGGYEIERKNIAANQILGNTAAAVSYAKNVAHKPYVFLDENLEKEFLRIHQLEEDVRMALEKGEFEPFYQPKVDAKSGTLIGAEALVRWRHKERIIMPGEFVGVIEKNGSVCDLDFCVLERVCKDVRTWLDQGLEPVPVSVNFSRRNLGNPILAEAIYNVTQKYNVPQNLIQVEITETLDEYPLSYLIGVVEALRRYGMTVAIDDFGTGSSSIKLLKDVTFDVLKIDKTFVDYQDDREKDLLEDIIHIANHIGISVIAEGVEERYQVEELMQMGCMNIQGFVFDKPMEKGKFEERLKQKEIYCQNPDKTVSKG